MGKCKNCGTLNASDAKFCRNCGQSIYTQSPKNSLFTKTNKRWYSDLLPDGDDVIKGVIIVAMIIACIVLLIKGGPMAGLIVPGTVIIYKYWRDD